MIKKLLLLLAILTLTHCENAGTSKNNDGDADDTAELAPISADNSSEDTEPISPTEKNKFLYITNDTFHTISKLNLTDFTLEANIVAGDSPENLTASDDGNFLITTDGATSNLTFIDTKTNSTKTIAIDVTNVIDMAISETNDRIFILSNDATFEILFLDDYLSVTNSTIIPFEFSPTKIEQSDNYIVLFNSSDDRIAILNKADNSLKTISICSNNQFAQFYEDDSYLFLNCDESLVIYDIPNESIHETLTLPFIPEQMTTNDDHNTLYFVHGENFIELTFDTIDDPTETTATIPGLDEATFMIYELYNSTEYLHIIDNMGMISFNMNLYQFLYFNSGDIPPIKIHYYNDDLFIVHQNPLGYVTKMARPDFTRLTLEGFALTDWLDR